MDKLTYEQVEEIFESIDSEWEGDNFRQGARIIEKYLEEKDRLIGGATHDTVWCADVETMIERGMTEDEFKRLALLNWHIEEGALCCFV